LRAVFKKPGCKNVAAELNLSLSLIHQWSRARDGGSDALNPLDRVAALMQFTRDQRLIEWLCEKAGGRFVAFPKAAQMSSAELVRLVSGAIQNLGAAQAALLARMNRPGSVTISPKAARAPRPQ
jgi:hypothetical protein